MSLTQRQVTLIQTTFELFAPRANEVGELFYAHLFEIAPHFRPLFTHAIKDQSAKLMGILAVAVHNLNNLGSIIPAVQALGSRHVKYGVMPDDYDVVGAALLWTLEQGLGDAFTDEVRDAWAAAYGVLAATAIGENYPIPA